MEMVNENLISTLEQSLRQIRQSRTQKVSRLREIEGEADNLKQEIEALDSSAEQIEKTIHSLLFSVRSSKALQKRQSQREIERELPQYDDDEIDLDDIINRYPAQPKHNSSTGNYNNQRSVVPLHRNGGRQDIPAAHPDMEPRNYRFRDRTITQACSVLMREANRPLHVNEIYNRLLESGMIFNGNNPTISIAVSLNRNRRFRKVAPGTFDLVMRDASAAS